MFLKGQEPGHDYINAVFVNVSTFFAFHRSYVTSPFFQGYKHQKAFIVAQNPLPSTIRNFWKVIFDWKCAAVVMLTPLTENGEEACSQYWPESGSDISFGEFTINNLGEETNNGFIMRELSVLNTKVCVFLKKTGIHFCGLENKTNDYILPLT